MYVIYCTRESGRCLFHVTNMSFVEYICVANYTYTGVCKIRSTFLEFLTHKSKFCLNIIQKHDD